MAPEPAHALTRRTFLRGLAAVGASVALGSLVDACSTALTPGPTISATPTASPQPATVAPGSTATTAPTPVPPHEAALSVYGWDGYLAPDTIPGFEKRYGIKVRYDTFIDEGTQLQALRRDGKGGGYDVTYPAAGQVPSLATDGVVRRIDASLVPNLANLAPEWTNPAYDPANAHSIPNYWWTTGYAWDPAKLSGARTSWADLWNADVAGHLAMLDDMRQAFAAGAFALGLSPNTTDEAELDRIVAKLQAQKALGRAWTQDPIGDIDGGDIWITQCESRDWSQMTTDLPAAQYVIPSEGALRGNDTLVILSGAKHPIAAHLWLDYNLEPQVAANNASAIGTMTPNRAAVDLVDHAITGDPRLNPPADVLARLQDLAPLGAADLAKYATRWNALRSGG